MQHARARTGLLVFGYLAFGVVCVVLRPQAAPRRPAPPPVVVARPVAPERSVEDPTALAVPGPHAGARRVGDANVVLFPPNSYDPNADAIDGYGQRLEGRLYDEAADATLDLLLDRPDQPLIITGFADDSMPSATERARLDLAWRRAAAVRDEWARRGGSGPVTLQAAVAVATDDGTSRRVEVRAGIHGARQE